MAEHVIVPINYIERKPNSEKFRVVGKGVTVDFLSLFIDDPEWPIDRICQDYDLTPAEVHAAWSVYYDHKDEIDQRRIDNRAYTGQFAAQDAEKRDLLNRRSQLSSKGNRIESNDAGALDSRDTE